MATELSAKQRKVVLNAVTYRIDELITVGKVSENFISGESNNSFEDILDSVINNLVQSGFSNVEVVSKIDDANCIIQLFKEENCESNNCLFDICGAVTFVKIKGKWINYKDRKWYFNKVLFELEISYPELEMGEDFSKYSSNPINVFLSLS